MDPLSPVEKKVGVLVPCEQDQLPQECHVEAIDLERSVLLALRRGQSPDALDPSARVSGIMVQQLGAVEQQSGM